MTPVYERLESLEKIGIKLGLRNIKTILEALGKPQTAYCSILLAGTNGKGSTGAMLDSILSKSGFTIGYYTSPHLIDVKERIRVNQRTISEHEFDQVLTTVFEAVDEMIASARLEVPPTYFEVLTAAGLLYFCNVEVDFAVVEVGLGGRFDATNAITQSLSLITSIDYDHEEFLGKSLAQIASEKAGIFKSGVPAVCGPLPREASEIIRETAERFNCKLTMLDPASLSDIHLDEGFPVFQYAPWNRQIRVNLRGRHQAINAGLALLACCALREDGVEITTEAVVEGLNDVNWPGRLDVLQKNPPVLLDCAHNPMGVRSLAMFMKDIGWNKVVTLFAAMKDKKIQGMLHEISPYVEHMILTRVHPLSRCATQEQLEKACFMEKIPFEFDYEAAESGLNKAIMRANELQLPLVIFGSIYLAGEILKSYKKSE